MLNRDQLLNALLWALALIVAAIFAMMLGDMAIKGISRLSWNFVIEAPVNSGRSGGIASILVSTLLIVFTAIIVTIPLGLAAAIWFSEFTRMGSAIQRAVRICLDVLAGVPSIVWGLFGNAFFCKFLGLGFSILSGGLTLACMMLPIFIRLSESALAAVPDDWRRACSALSLSKVTQIVNVLLPAVAPAIASAIVLSIGRAFAETAALVFTSGYVDRMPSSLLDSGRALSVHIFDLAMNVTGGDASAYASALVLVMVVVLMNIGAHLLGKQFGKHHAVS